MNNNWWFKCNDQVLIVCFDIIYNSYFQILWLSSILLSCFIDIIKLFIIVIQKVLRGKHFQPNHLTSSQIRESIFFFFTNELSIFHVEKRTQQMYKEVSWRDDAAYFCFTESGSLPYQTKMFNLTNFCIYQSRSAS